MPPGGGAEVLTRLHPASGSPPATGDRHAIDSRVLARRAGAGPADRPPGAAEAKDSFKIAWSIYVGWMPWGYAADSGIVKKWADKYGIKIELMQINDYVESINQYTAGKFDGCVMTNMDALTIPAAGGVDSTALIVGDFSNGNDGIVLKGGEEARRHQGPEVNLVELRSRTTCWRAALEIGRAGRARRQGGEHLRRRHRRAPSPTPDVDRRRHLEPAARRGHGDARAPRRCSTLSKIPGEIIDLMVVNTADAEGQPEPRQGAGRRLVRDAGVMTGERRDRPPPRSTRWPRPRAPTSPASRRQLATTTMFCDAGRGRRVHHQPEPGRDHGPRAQVLLRARPARRGRARQWTRSASRFPGGKTLGDANNVKLRFDADYMKLAADGKL